MDMTPQEKDRIRLELARAYGRGTLGQVVVLLVLAVAGSFRDRQTFALVLLVGVFLLLARFARSARQKVALFDLLDNHPASIQEVRATAKPARLFFLIPVGTLHQVELVAQARTFALVMPSQAAAAELSAGLRRWLGL